MVRRFFRCPECEAAIVPLTRMCAECGADIRAISARKTFLAAVASLVGITIISLAVHGVRQRVSAWRETHLTQLQNTPPLLGAPANAMRATPEKDFAWIEKAMADCDKDAVTHPDTLYFLVTPLVATGMEGGSAVSHPLGQIGHSATLLPSKEALAGLRDGSFELYSGQFVFAIMEPTTKVTYQWKLASGVSKFVTPDASAVSAFIPGVQVEQSETTWASSAAQRHSACYWVNLLLH